MHGRVKTRSSAEEQEVKRKEREKKSKLYRAGIERAFAKRQAKEFDDDALKVSGQLLVANPDITTLWNIRREILLHLKDQDKRDVEEMQARMKSELELVAQCLRANPKSYGAWHHRMWVLDTMPKPEWQGELALCTKYLDLDERNFHVWNYRKFVVKRSGVPPSDEFEYSTKKILTNFSNYSSWHYRSRLLPLVFPDPLGKLPIREDKHKEELRLVQNAAFTDPNDQSAWFYQRWLLGRSPQPLQLVQVHVGDHMVCVALTRSAGSECLQLRVGGAAVPAKWRSSNGQLYCHVWVCCPPEDQHPAVTVCLMDGTSVVQERGPGAGTKPQFGAGLSEGITSVLQDELESCEQLLELEPDSKWTLLTAVLLMQAVDRHRYREDTFAKLSQLEQVDPLRRGYYRDLRSRYEMEYALDSCSMPEQQSVCLAQHQLTGLYHCHFLSCIQTVDLSHNCLGSRSLPQLHALQCCQVLKLDHNNISSLREMPALLSLTTLSLRGNKISSLDHVKFLKVCPSLTSLDLGDNPAQVDADLIKTFLPEIKTLGTVMAIA
ncbi:geranylgeranyl transferase type-2 subunit alpha isoform X2 [Periplaneta americana]|uniref:geranylgeranyl transferase type-2 subunit alpha isoform X1 n=1 Tax=Periplaneta americana TaxID=6978 RepID=UPI0037E92086